MDVGTSRHPLSSRWTRIAILLVGGVVTLGLYDRRGLVIAAIGAAVWGGLFASSWRGGQRASAWSRAHPVADSALMLPIAFVSLAYLTRLGVVPCASIACALWLVVLVLGPLRRGAVFRRRPGAR